MPTKYTIHRIDPFNSTSFNVSAYTSNGPIFPLSTVPNGTAVSIDTSFVFYGKGHPEYGERIQENILHLLENFSGSIEPKQPISGQLWFQQFVYIKTNLGWWYWDQSLSQWVSFVPQLGQPTSFNHGDFWLDGSTLMRILNSPDHPMSPTALTVIWDDLPAVANPNGEGIVPRKRLVVYDGSQWKDVSNVRSSTDQPSSATTGDLWFDLGPDNQLKIFDGTNFVSVADNYLPLSGGLMFGPIDMGSNGINNLADPLLPQDAATMQWTQNEITTSIAAAISSTVLNDLNDVSFGGTDPIPGPGNPYFKYDSVSGLWKASHIYFNDLADTATSGVTVGDLQQLIGVTSPIQTQLDGKVEKSGDHMTGVLWLDGNNIKNVADPVDLQDAATKNYVDTQIASIPGGGTTDTYLQTAILDSVVGSPTEGYLTLTMNDATTHTIAGFAVQGHQHNSSDINHTPLPSTLLGKILPPVTTVEEALYHDEEIMKRRTQPRRLVHVVAADSTGPFFTPQYEPGRHKLQVFLNGIKLIADEMAYEAALFTNLVDGSTDTGLAASTSYQFTIDVDGAGATTITITTPAYVSPDFYSFTELETDINNELQLAGLGATCIFEEGEMAFYSDTHGASASIALTDIDLFSSINGATTFTGFTGPGVGVDYGYRETGPYGDTTGLGDSITTISTVPAGSTFEFIVLGDSGLP